MVGENVGVRTSVFHPSTVALPNGWTMRRIWLDINGYDRDGWRWARNDGPRIYHLTNSHDSLSVIARSPVEAIALVSVDGWPPRKTKRFNWEYDTL